MRGAPGRHRGVACSRHAHDLPLRRACGHARAAQIATCVGNGGARVRVCRFLAALKKVWLDHKRSLLMVRDILMYMDRTYVKQNQKRPVYEMGLAIFCQYCTRAPRVKERLRDLLLDLIRKERDGEKIDRDLVRSVTQMLMDMGKTVFAEDFERPFLDSSQEYYTMWTESRISACSTPEYLKNVDTRIQEEAERVKACLCVDYNAGESGIKNVVETQLIARHMETLVSKEVRVRVRVRVRVHVHVHVRVRVHVGG